MASGRHRWDKNMFPVWLCLLATAAAMSSVAAGGITCPRQCDCSYVSRDSEIQLHITCFVWHLKDFNFHKLSTIMEPYSMEVYCDSSVPNELSDYMLSSLNYMYAVSFQNCKLSYIHRHVFDGLPNLQQLDIHKASMFHLQIHPLAFESVRQSIGSISLIDSGVTSLPSLCDLTKLRGFNVSGNAFMSFQDVGLTCENDQVFDKLKVIDVSNNNIKNISDLAYISTHLPALEIFAASNNLMTLLSDDTPFKDFKHIRMIQLSGNKISRLSEALIHTNTKLESLDLANNIVEIIPEHFFSHSNFLLLLDLHSNRLDDTAWTGLNPLLNVMYLDLSSNHITAINAPVLSHFTELTTLSLADNNILLIPDKAFRNQLQLHELDLADNVLHTLDREALYGLMQLSKLHLQSNRLYSLSPDLLNSVLSLTHLNVSTNFLQELPTLKKLSTLLVLDVSSNAIDTLPDDMLLGLTNLRDINFSNNQIRVLSETVFMPCDSLETLDLSNNIIEFIHPSMFMDITVQILVLDGNRIKDIGKTFANMKYLRVLSLSRNEIRDTMQKHMLPETLEMVDLSFNNIENIRQNAFHGLPKIRMVDLRFNKIKTLSEKSLAVSTGLYAQTGFLIDQNPLKCDCNLLWLKRWDQSTHGPIIANLNITNCTGAYHFKEYPVQLVPEDRFLCRYENVCPVSCHCCDFIACDCKYTCPDKCECYRSSDYSTRHYVECAEKNLTEIYKFIPRLATAVNLSGNDIRETQSHSFIGMTNLTTLYLNKSSINTIHNRTFAGLYNLKTLYLNFNFIELIQTEMFSGLTALQKLYLDHNHISYIQDGVFDRLPSLVTLHLSHNYLQYMDYYTSHLVFSIHDVTLHSNPWLCDCILYFSAKHNPLAFINDNTDPTTGRSINCTVNSVNTINHVAILDDYESICKGREHQYVHNQLAENLLTVRKNSNIDSDNKSETNTTGDMYQAVNDEDARKAFWNAKLNVFLPVMLGSTLLLVLLISILCRREFVKIWLFTKCKCRSRENEILYDKSRTYDAFVAYHTHDDAYVIRDLVLRLERGKPNYNLLVQHRDCYPGGSLHSFIENGVRSSHRTIIVLSAEYIREGSYLKFVSHCIKQDSIRRLIVVVLGKIDTSTVDPVIRSYMKSERCIHYGEYWFWKKLFYCLPQAGPLTPVVPRAEIRPYATTDLLRLAPSMMDNRAYEEPISVTSRPLPTVSDYVPTSQSYNYGGSQNSSNIYEEIKDAVGNCELTSSKYDTPWDQIRVEEQSEEPVRREEYV